MANIITNNLEKKRYHSDVHEPVRTGTCTRSVDLFIEHTFHSCGTWIAVPCLQLSLYYFPWFLFFQPPFSRYRSAFLKMRVEKKKGFPCSFVSFRMRPPPPPLCTTHRKRESGEKLLDLAGKV